MFENKKEIDYNKSFLKDRDIEVKIVHDKNSLTLKSPFTSNDIRNKHVPFKQNFLTMPGNYLDFLKFAYVSLSNDTFKHIPFFYQKPYYDNISDLAYNRSENGYMDYLLAKYGLKYYIFYSVAKSKLTIEYYTKKENPIKTYLDSSQQIENLFLELDEFEKNTNKSLIEILSKSDKIDKFLIESIKMEEITNMFNDKSRLDKFGIYSNEKHGEYYEHERHQQRHNDGNRDVPGLFGDENNLYLLIVSLMKKLNYNLENPVIPEGMVSREELKLELEKINPGVSREEMNLVLSKYPNIDQVDLKLMNHYTKTDIDTLLSSFVTKADSNKFVLNEHLRNYVLMTELNNMLSQYLPRTEYKEVDSYSKLELDAKYANYYEKHIIDSFLTRYASKEELTEEIKKLDLTNFVKRDLLNQLLENYISVHALNTTLDNYSLKTELSNYITSEEANNKFALKEDIPQLGPDGNVDLTDYAKKEYVDNSITAFKVSELAKYSSTEEIENKLNEFTRKTEFESYKTTNDESVNSLKTKVEGLESKVTNGSTSVDHSTEIQTLQQKDTEIESKLSNIESTLTNKIESSALDTKADISALEAANAKITSLEEKNTALEAKVTTLESTIAELTSRIEALESPVQS